MYFTKKQVFSVLDIKTYDIPQKFVLGFAPIRIRYLGENFRKILEIGVQERNICSNYQALTLSDSYTGLDFIRIFGEKCSVSLHLIWLSLLKQPYGEVGVLSTNGTTNIFVVIDNNNNIYTIGVFWYKSGWSIRAYPLTDSNKKTRNWFAGNQIITELF